ncbi:MAG: hypothetical protein STSR0004_06660 [Peptococcaceae bacterium]
MEKIKLKKATFSIPEPVLKKLSILAKKNRKSSVNAIVREALELYIVEVERREFRLAMIAAANDPVFIRDLHETESAFRYADAESAEMIPEW